MSQRNFLSLYNMLHKSCQVSQHGYIILTCSGFCLTTITKSGFRFTLRSPPLPCLDSPSHTWSRLLWRIPTGDQSLIVVWLFSILSDNFFLLSDNFLVLSKGSGTESYISDNKSLNCNSINWVPGVLAWQAVVEGAWRPRKGFLWMGRSCFSPRVFFYNPVFFSAYFASSSFSKLGVLLSVSFTTLTVFLLRLFTFSFFFRPIFSSPVLLAAPCVFFYFCPPFLASQAFLPFCFLPAILSYFLFPKV